jgi:hypothetical protein
MLEAPYPYHEGSVKHILKDCNLMKNFLGIDSKKKSLDAAKAGAAKTPTMMISPRRTMLS